MDRTAIATSGFTAFNEAGLDWHSVALLNRPELADQYSPGIAAERNNFHQTLFVHEKDYFQFEQGLMLENAWHAKLDGLTFFNNQRNYQDIMTIRKSFFPKGLVDVIDSLPDNCAE